MDVVAGELSDDAALAKCRDEIIATRELLDLHPGPPDLRRAMRVAPDGAGKTLVFGERGRADVVLGECLPSVEDLDAIDVLPHALERRAAQVEPPVAAERMGDRDEAALSGNVA